MDRVIKECQIYKHFKGTYHKIICIALNSETLEKEVVYTHEEDNNIWVRPLKEFLSEVDHDKYPNVTQKYRFELVEDETK